MSLGESWGQVLALAGRIQGVEQGAGAQVRWRDTKSRKLSATVDAIGKVAATLGVPLQDLWERISGVNQQDVERWKTTVAEGDPIASLEAPLSRQGNAA